MADLHLGRLQPGDVARHLLLANGELVNALTHGSEIARYCLELLQVGRRGGGRGRRDHVRSGLRNGCGLRCTRHGRLKVRWARLLGDNLGVGQRVRRRPR